MAAQVVRDPKREWQLFRWENLDGSRNSASAETRCAGVYLRLMSQCAEWRDVRGADPEAFKYTHLNGYANDPCGRFTHSHGSLRIPASNLAVLKQVLVFACRLLTYL